jgi:diacylglycerol kinase
MHKHNLFDSFGFAFAGIAEALRTSRNLKIHLSATVLVFLAGLFFQVSKTEWLILLIVIGLVISAEIMNSAIEEACNVYDEKLNYPYGTTKVPRNMAAGAVLVMAIISVIIGLVIFLPKILFS